MMRNAAVPKAFLEAHLIKGDQIPPGHRFSLFFPYWKKDWAPASNEKMGAVKEVVPLGRAAREMLNAMISRQDELFQQAGDRHLTIRATSISPFMTGIGNEHPLENGFSFLLPYGLPYLPGSSVKGIIRRSAEELALGFFEDNFGWDLISLWFLFGFDASSAYFKANSSENGKKKSAEKDIEVWHSAYLSHIQKRPFDSEGLTQFFHAVLASKDRNIFEKAPDDFFRRLIEGKSGDSLREKIHLRGALSFWDVFPFPLANNAHLLKVEILTPHYRAYYAGEGSPADCGQPNPIPFLTIAPGCEFKFNILAHIDLMPGYLKDKWKALIEKAFEHAFDWLGFGARTSVGYGQMKREKLTSKEKMPLMPSSINGPAPENIERWERAILQWTPNDNTLRAITKEEKQKKALWKDPERSRIPEKYRKKLFEKREYVEANVIVSIIGNLYKIMRVE